MFLTQGFALSREVISRPSTPELCLEKSHTSYPRIVLTILYGLLNEVEPRVIQFMM